MATAKSHFTEATCPRCGRKTIRSNDVGAWCDGYPCRWSIKRTQAIDAARILREAW